MADLRNAAYERISAILDEGSFIELGASVTGRFCAGLPEAEKDGDGVITGYGTAAGRLVYVYAQNPAVAGGSIGEMHAEKISRLYRMAVSMGAPVLGIADCSGIRLNEGLDSLQSFGTLFAAQAGASGVIPQIMAVYGNCGGCMAVTASMADFVLMEKDAKLFVNSPDSVFGNYTEKCDTSSAEFQSSESGICDFAGTASEVAEKVRELLALLPENNESDTSAEVCPDDLNRSVSGIDTMKDPADILGEIADGGRFTELKKDHASGLTVGFFRLNGRTVGAVAGNGEVLSHFGCKKAIRFINFCDAFNVPVLTLCNVKGFARDRENEACLARALGKLTFTYAQASVPKVTLVTGKSFGTAGIVLGSRACGADLVFTWPKAEIGLMPKEDLYGLTGKNETKDVYSALYSAQRGFVDDIILPEETRQRLAAAFEMLYTKSVAVPARKHGTV